MTPSLTKLLAERRALDMLIARATAREFPVGSRWRYMSGTGSQPCEVVVTRHHANDPTGVFVFADDWPGEWEASLSRLAPLAASASPPAGER